MRQNTTEQTAVAAVRAVEHEKAERATRARLEGEAQALRAAGEAAGMASGEARSWAAAHFGEGRTVDSPAVQAELAERKRLDAAHRAQAALGFRRLD